MSAFDPKSFLRGQSFATLAPRYLAESGRENLAEVKRTRRDYEQACADKTSRQQSSSINRFLIPFIPISISDAPSLVSIKPSTLAFSSDGKLTEPYEPINSFELPLAISAVVFVVLSLCKPSFLNIFSGTKRKPEYPVSRTAKAPRSIFWKDLSQERVLDQHLYDWGRINEFPQELSTSVLRVIWT